MSSILDKGFRFTPYSSPQVITNSYTIPSNFFAHVTLFFYRETYEYNAYGTQPTISINGVSVLSNIGETFYLSTQTTFSNSPFDGKNSGKLDQSQGAPFPCVAHILSGTSSPTASYCLNYQGSNKLELFLKSGDVISGTGNWKSIVTLFSDNTVSTGIKNFNYAPQSTIITSSNYTIPSGKYGIGILYFLPTLFPLATNPVGFSNYPNVPAIYINGQACHYINNTTAYVYHEYVDKGGSTIKDNRLNKNYGGVAPEPKQVYLKEGDVISGDTGWQAIISLYNVTT